MEICEFSGPDRLLNQYRRYYDLNLNPLNIIKKEKYRLEIKGQRIILTEDELIILNSMLNEYALIVGLGIGYGKEAADDCGV